MVGAIDILEPGGDLIIASECSEGMGSAEYVAAQRRLTRIDAPKHSWPACFGNRMRTSMNGSRKCKSKR